MENKSKKVFCFGITNSFEDKTKKLFFNEYDNWSYHDIIEEATYLSKVFDIDIYIFKSSENNYHLISFDILDFNKYLTIINWCSNDGDYLYNFYDVNYEYVLRLSNKGKKNTPMLIKMIKGDLKNENTLSLKHIKAYEYFTGYKIVIGDKKVLDLDTKIVAYQTNKEKKV